MTTESLFPDNSRLPSANEGVRIGPVPDWVSPCKVEMTFSGQQKRPLTYLLVSRQIHAELKETFVHTAVRLETMEAVQHESQFRLSFEPSTQSLTLHWIKVRRGESVLDHARPELFRLLQREEGLERFVVDGWVTLLILLEDVRPGDVLETCYTLKRDTRLLPECCTGSFTLPSGLSVGHFQFCVRFLSARPLKWKSRLPVREPSQTLLGSETIWSWSGDNFVGADLEPNTPSWHLAASWVQVSDCPDWQTIAKAVATAWDQWDHDPAVGPLLAEIEEGAGDVSSRADKAIRLVQDEYRYLSVNLDLGGYIPTAPGVVIRRRFGDCKDLSLLLVQILRGLGIAARPILVATGLRKTVAEMLPIAEIFDHVVVEFQLLGKVVWVDPTMKHQGGGALNRVISQFGAGLPVDHTSSDLITQPQHLDQAGVYETKDCVLLSTSDRPSKLAIHVRATGNYADGLRHRFATVDTDTIANERLQECARRFDQAARVGPLQHRDDRDTNEFHLVETFQIEGFLTPRPEPGFCEFRFPPSIMFSALQLPEARPRTAPFLLPFPCQIIHAIEVEAQTLQPMAAPRFDLATKYLRFGRRQKSLPRFWSMTLSLETLADAIPPADVPEHRVTLEEIWKKSGWGLIMPTGFFHPKGSSSFGELPPLPRRSGIRASAPAVAVTSSPANQDSSGAPSAQSQQATPVEFIPPGRVRGRSRTRSGSADRYSRHSRRFLKAKDWLVLAGAIVLALTLGFTFYALVHRHHR